MTRITILLLFISTSILSQKTDYNTKKGYVANGYDVFKFVDVEYFLVETNLPPLSLKRPYFLYNIESL